MKKQFLCVLALILVISLVACSKGNSNSGNENGTPAVTDSSLELMNKVWDKIGEGIPAIGGDFNDDGSHVVDGAPGAFDVSNTQALSNQLYVPESAHTHIKECASLMHMMNANTLTIAAYKVEGLDDFGTIMANALKETHWMCGMPEKVYIAAIGAKDYVVAFGVADVISDMDTALNELYGGSLNVLCNEELAF